MSDGRFHETPEEDTSRRAFAIVSDHLRQATVGLGSRGVSGRLLPGLWHASMSVVVSSMDAHYAALLIEDRSVGIKGRGLNADAPLKSYSDSGLAQYLEEVKSAAEVFAERLEEALEVLSTQGIEDSFPECVLDAMIQVLVPAWGPEHVRRALSEQWITLREGSARVVTVMEPAQLNLPQSSHGKDASSDEAKPPLTHTSPRRTPSERFIEAYVDSDVDPATGQGAWAVAMRVHERGGRLELREMCGPVRDATGRTSCLQAVIEAMRAITESGKGATIRMEVSSDFVIRAMTPASKRSSGDRLDSEAEIWSEIDVLSARHNVDWRHVPSGTDRDLAERCDRLVRRILSTGAGHE